MYLYSLFKLHEIKTDLIILKCRLENNKNVNRYDFKRASIAAEYKIE